MGVLEVEFLRSGHQSGHLGFLRIPPLFRLRTVDAIRIMNFRESMTASTHPRTQARTLFSDPTRGPIEGHAGETLVLAFLPRFARRAAEFVSVRLLSIMAFSPAGVIRARTDGRTLIGLGRSPSGTPAHQLSHSRQRRKRPASIASLVLVEKARNGEPCRFPDGRVFPADPRARARARPCESFNHLAAARRFLSA